MTSQPAIPTSTVSASGDYAFYTALVWAKLNTTRPGPARPERRADGPCARAPGPGTSAQDSGWAEAGAPVAQRILSDLLIQWSRVRFPGKQLAASSLLWPPSEQGETSTVARWSQEDMVLGPKLAAPLWFRSMN